MVTNLPGAQQLQHKKGKIVQDILTHKKQT